MLILALTLLVFQIMRLKIESLYVTTVAVRLMILACLVWLYLQSRDPFFIIVIAIVSLGVMLTISGYYMD